MAFPDEDQVTTPRNDGTRGSALYAIPFQLSRHPPHGWSELFVLAWDRPEKYTTMHRPGIARVLDDKVILDGTTIKEVEQYHRDTLKLAVDVANNEYARLQAKQEKRRLSDIESKRAHEESVRDAAKRIDFD